MTHCLTVGEVRRRIANGSLTFDGQQHLLVIRLRHADRVAWLHGRRIAQIFEKRCTSILRHACSSLLRRSDLVIHDRGSRDLAILLMPRTASTPHINPEHARRILQRILSACTHRLGILVDGGWATLYEHTSMTRFDLLIEEALQRGIQEQMRYAFLGILGHELRTPLTSIQGYTETLLNESLSQEQQRSFLKTMRREALRMNEVIGRFFDLAMLDLDSPAQRNEANRCWSTEVIEEAFEQYRSSHVSSTLRIHFENAFEAFVSIKKSDILHIILNILDNAHKHAGERSNLLVCTSSINDGLLCISFEDDGPGVEQNDRERIFLLGERGETHAAGTGIGLTLARRLAHRAGGSLECTASTLGGCGMRLTLIAPPIHAATSSVDRHR